MCVLEVVNIRDFAIVETIDRSRQTEKFKERCQFLYNENERNMKQCFLGRFSLCVTLADF